MAKKKISKNSSQLSGCTKITSLDLFGCESLQNVDGLVNLTKLTSLDLNGCYQLSVSSDDDELTTRKQVAKQLGIKTLNETAFKRLLGGGSKKATKKKATKKAAS